MESQNAIIFIDELHTLVGAGSGRRVTRRCQYFEARVEPRRNSVHRRQQPPGEYRKSVEKDRSLERRFQSVKVGAPNEDDAIRVLQGVRDRYEKFHAVSYTDEAVSVTPSICRTGTFQIAFFRTRPSICSMKQALA